MGVSSMYHKEARREVMTISNERVKRLAAPVMPVGFTPCLDSISRLERDKQRWQLV